MKTRVAEILKKDIGAILGSPFVLEFLQVYSILFLDGAPPKVCSECIKGYYNDLKLYGMDKAKLFEQIKNRTCIPNFAGTRYYHATGEHISAECMTDDQAIIYLQRGLLNNADFSILPKKYINEIKLESSSETNTYQAKQKHKKR